MKLIQRNASTEKGKFFCDDNEIHLDWMEKQWLIRMIEEARDKVRNVPGVSDGLGYRAREFLEVLAPDSKPTIDLSRNKSWTDCVLGMFGVRRRSGDSS